MVWALGLAARGNRDAFLLSTTGETTSALESAMARVARDMTRARARDTLVHYLRIVEAGAAFGAACEGAIAALSERVTRADEPFEPDDAASRLVGVMRAHIMLRDAGRSHKPSPELAMRTLRLLARREMRGARRSNAHGVVLVAAEFVEAIGARGALAGGNAAARSSCTTSIALCGGGDARSRARRPFRTRASRDAPARTRRGANDVVANA